jgi:phosphoenolpyruvate synthase/pyruvate phosphate dikinase
VLRTGFPLTWLFRIRAIVARELGIPAVVNCGNATMRLKTGDWVLVDGGQGTVEILESARVIPPK